MTLLKQWRLGIAAIATLSVGCAEGNGDLLDIEQSATERPTASEQSKELLSPRLAAYRVTVTNLSETQPFTPPVVATHSARVALFRTGFPAPNGVREIAENGALDPLLDALGNSPRVRDFAVGIAGDPPPLMPGQSVSVEVEAGAFDRLSMAAMLICSNDGFTGVDSVRLPRFVGQTFRFTARSYDAGSEINTEDFADIVPPCQALRGVSSDDPGTGASNPALAENGVVGPHPGIDGDLPTSDLLRDVHAIPARAALVEVTRIARYEVEIANLTAGQPFTPPVVATHSRGVSLFRAGRPASEGIREIAENGNVAPLVDALSSSNAVSDVQVAAGTPPPLLPGASIGFEITSDLASGRLSFASMLICTNDGFTGVNSLRLPRRVGAVATATGRGYDAGTEVNTEDFADIVPPCQSLIGVESDDAGTGQSDPTLAENGVVELHPGVDGGLQSSDLTIADHGWDVRAPTVSVRVKRVQ